MNQKEKDDLHLLHKRELAQENVIINHKLLLNTLNSIKECISITDMNDIIIYVNKAFEHTYGFTYKELIGKHISILHPNLLSKEELKEINKVTLKGGWQGEVYNKKKDDSNF